MCVHSHMLTCRKCLCAKGGRLKRGKEGGTVSLPNVFPGCVTVRRRWAGLREVPRRNRESDVSCYSPQLKEEGKGKEGEEVEKEEEA